MKMRDIAAAVGVSAMTVSRALRKDSSVAPETRKAILKAIEEKGYVPNQIAGSLSSARSGFVAVLVPSLNNLHFGETVLKLSQELEKADIQLLIGNTDYDRAKETALVRAFLARKPEAVVLTNDGHTAGLRKLLAQASVPVIEIWDLPEEPIQHVVGFSNREAMRDLVLAMAAKGYRRIAYLGESDDAGTRGSSRRQGYLEAIAERGLGAPRLSFVGRPPATMSDGAAALDRVLGAFPDTDLVICVSDPLAFGVIAACQRRGLGVPEDLAVAGFGDFEIGRIAIPTITTVAIDPGAVGGATAELVAGLLADRAAPQPPMLRRIATRTVIRDSAPGRPMLNHM
jgi:LacI family transcriptional regulator, gluconate utilization system Gnt-I transcriptional repressor